MSKKWIKDNLTDSQRRNIARIIRKAKIETDRVRYRFGGGESQEPNIERTLSSLADIFLLKD